MNMRRIVLPVLLTFALLGALEALIAAFDGDWGFMVIQISLSSFCVLAFVFRDSWTDG